ncbi:endonuclease/exonuclease/phosphatase family protein [Porphyromonas pogonae]|uniref:endonuclease/exonuclease/phosphatase family protein n=1 Tax=Porphyromonas pogonae TaxID=867595 RepID=UPI002E774C81|nr:endonuclease/exonuclease/phosphatase family protein [Porphyromonas pogonae]
MNLKSLIAGLAITAIGCTYCAAAIPLKVMTYNIRYKNDHDKGDNNWEKRKGYVASMINLFSPDIIGLQEVLYPQLLFMEKALACNLYGVGREDGKTEGEYSPVGIRNKSWTVVKKGYFWLSENPNKPGKGWDAACERIATWNVLKNKISGKEIFFMNTHLDHEGKTARHNSALLLLKKINELAGKRPVILCGDFNSIPDDDVIKTITDKNNPSHLRDCRIEAENGILSPGWSYQEFGRIPGKEVLIDYIFVRGNIDVKDYMVCDVKFHGNYPSDHCPVIVNLEIK